MEVVAGGGQWALNPFVTLKEGNMAGQPSKVTAVATQPSPHFFENPCQYSVNPDRQQDPYKAQF